MKMYNLKHLRRKMLDGGRFLPIAADQLQIVKIALVEEQGLHIAVDIGSFCLLTISKGGSKTIGA